MTSVVNVKDFGAVGDGVTNDTAAFQTAANSLTANGGGILYVPRSTYLLDNLSLSSAISMEGDGRFATVLKASSALGDFINVNYSFCSIRHMKFTADSNRTSGAYITSAGNFCNFEDLYFEKYFGGINITAGTNPTIDNCKMYEGSPESFAPLSYGIKLGPNPIVGAAINNVLMDSPSGQPSYGIVLYQSDACMISNCNIIRHGLDLAILPNAGQGVHATYISNSYFDTAVRGIMCHPSNGGVITRLSLSNVWANSHIADGIYLDGIVGTAQLNSVRASLCGARGILVSANVDSTKLVDIVANGNGSDGVAFGSGATHFKVIGSEAIGNGGAGICLGGSNNYYIISGNDLCGNPGGGVTGFSISSTQIVTNNIG